MGNSFCIIKKELIQIFYGEMAGQRVEILLDKFYNKYSIQEILQQAQTGEGEIGEYVRKENDKFAEKTANDEIGNAIALADFYFPDTDPMICFKMKNGFNKNKIISCEELIKNIESNSEIDFVIKDKVKKFNFQLKQYPEKYKEWSVLKVIEYLDKAILPKEKYNNESNKDLIIVITIKPKQQSTFKRTKDFVEIHKYLSDKKNKLSEINFLYNKNNEHMVWYQVFPQCGYSKIPWKQLSYHQAKIN